MEKGKPNPAFEPEKNGDIPMENLKEPIKDVEAPVDTAEKAHDPDDLEWEFEDADFEEPNLFMRGVGTVQTTIATLYNDSKKQILLAVAGLFLIGFHVYFGFAVAYSVRSAVGLICFVIIGWLLVLYGYVVVPLLEKSCNATFSQVEKAFDNAWRIVFVRWGVYLGVMAALAIFLAVDTRNDRSRLVPFGGLMVYVLLLFVFSANPARVRWRPVVWGLGLQFCLGLLVLRWKTGTDAFHYASDQVVRFLDYTKNGTIFVYGFLAEPPNVCGPDGNAISPVFVFTVLQVVIYFGSIVSVMYFFGIMQRVLIAIAWGMQFTMGTTAAESLNTAACIFLGQSEAPLLIKPYIARMTNSEIHAVMTGGFACIAGSLFAAYISFGACPSYLLSATVMSAPAALAVSKLFYPETKKSKLKRIEDLKLPPSEENNALEAISNGAVSTTELVWAITANLIVFLALLAFVDNIIGWIGGMIGFPQASFELIMGYVFYPLAYMMGSGKDSLRVGELMGTKTFLNEFIAYQKLGKMVEKNEIEPRAQMIATYALCGFSNIGSIGIQLGTLGGLCPEKKPVIAKIAVRALIAGMFACFMTACIAGITHTLMIRILRQQLKHHPSKFSSKKEVCLWKCRRGVILRNPKQIAQKFNL